MGYSPWGHQELDITEHACTSPSEPLAAPHVGIFGAHLASVSLSLSPGVRMDLYRRVVWWQVVETTSAVLEELGLSSGIPKGIHRMETGGQSGLPHGLMLTPSPPATVSKPQERVAQPQTRTASHTPLCGVMGGLGPSSKEDIMTPQNYVQ